MRRQSWWKIGTGRRNWKSGSRWRQDNQNDDHQYGSETDAAGSGARLVTIIIIIIIIIDVG